jgi:hypothetical protein
LVATVAEAKSLDDFLLFALGTTVNLTQLITRIADGFAGLVASVHRFDLVTHETLLVRGRVSVTSHPIAGRTDGFAGLTILTGSSALSADITSTLHGYTSFRFLDFEK